MHLPAHRGVKHCLIFFFSGIPKILHNISGIPKTNREIGHRGTIIISSGGKITRNSKINSV